MSRPEGSAKIASLSGSQNFAQIITEMLEMLYRLPHAQDYVYRGSPMTHPWQILLVSNIVMTLTMGYNPHRSQILCTW